MSQYQKGNIVEAIVTGITDYGVFVSLDENYSGLIHISEISSHFVKDVNDFVKMGETIYVQILDVNHHEQRVKLSIKNIQYRKEENRKRRRKIVETPTGFYTLSKNLPTWIEEYLKKQQKPKNSIDKQGIK